jgi:hypothetical protein
MKEESYLEARTPEAAQELTMIDISQGLSRFRFHDHFPLDKEIESVEPDHLIEKVDRNENFTFHFEAEFSKNACQGLDINLLEKAKPQFIMNEVKGPNDRFSDLGVKKIYPGF